MDSVVHAVEAVCLTRPALRANGKRGDGILTETETEK